MTADPGDPPVLVDTSVWIELLRDSEHPLRSHLENLVATDRARICRAIVAELIQGAVSAKDLEAAEGLAETVPLLEADDFLWLEAGRLGRRLRQKGATVGLFDCYLAALATKHQCLLLSLDKHFAWISKASPLLLDPRSGK